MPVTVPVLVLVLVLVLVAMPVTVAVARAGHFLHAFILREEIRFRTSTTTRNAHMRNERNNSLLQEAIPRAAKRIASGPAFPASARSSPVATASPRARTP
jgi:hypothetical protein